VNMINELKSTHITGLVIPLLGENGESARSLRPEGFEPM